MGDPASPWCLSHIWQWEIQQILFLVQSKSIGVEMGEREKWAAVQITVCRPWSANPVTAGWPSNDLPIWSLPVSLQGICQSGHCQLACQLTSCHNIRQQGLPTTSSANLIYVSWLLADPIIVGQLAILYYDPTDEVLTYLKHLWSILWLDGLSLDCLPDSDFRSQVQSAVVTEDATDPCVNWSDWTDEVSTAIWTDALICSQFFNLWSNFSLVADQSWFVFFFSFCFFSAVKV